MVDASEGTGRRTDLCEILKIHQAVPSLVMIAQNLEDFCFLHIEAECTHGDLEFMVVDAAIFVCVEEFESLFDFLLLFVGELRTRVRAAFCLLSGR